MDYPYTSAQIASFVGTVQQNVTNPVAVAASALNNLSPPMTANDFATIWNMAEGTSYGPLDADNLFAQVTPSNAAASAAVSAAQQAISSATVPAVTTVTTATAAPVYTPPTSYPYSQAQISQFVTDVQQQSSNPLGLALAALNLSPPMTAGDFAIIWNLAEGTNYTAADAQTIFKQATAPAPAATTVTTTTAPVAPTTPSALSQMSGIPDNALTSFFGFDYYVSQLDFASPTEYPVFYIAADFGAVVSDPNTGAYAWANTSLNPSATPVGIGIGITIAGPAYEWVYDVNSHSFIASGSPSGNGEPVSAVGNQANALLANPITYPAPIQVDTIFPGMSSLDFARLGIDERAYVLWCVALLSTSGATNNQAGPHVEHWSNEFGASAAKAGLTPADYAKPQIALYWYGTFVTAYAAHVAYDNNPPQHEVAGDLLVLAVVAAAIYFSGGASLSMFGSTPAPGSLSAADVQSVAQTFPVDMSSVTPMNLADVNISQIAPVISQAGGTTGVFFDSAGNAFSTADAAAASDASFQSGLDAITAGENVTAAGQAAAAVTSGLPALDAATASATSIGSVMTIAQTAASTLTSAAASGNVATAAAAATSAGGALSTASSWLSDLSPVVKALPVVGSLIAAVSHGSLVKGYGTTTPPVTTVTVGAGAPSSPFAAFANMSPIVKDLLIAGGIVGAAVLFSSHKSSKRKAT